MKKRQEQRSPIKDPPLRSAGQSIDEEINRILNEDVGSYIAISVLVIVMAGYETYRWYAKSPPQPAALWVFAVIVCIYSLFKIMRLRKKVRQLRQGRDGEKAVAEGLEQLRRYGYKVFHDVVGDGFNVDHVLIGPTGVFTIETKAISKPVRGNAKIHYDGEKVTIDGFQPDRNPITQAKAQASWLKTVIRESTGKPIDVRPMVTYPGWYVDYPRKRTEVVVISAKGLPGFLRKCSNQLSEADLNLVNSSLMRYIRHSERARRS